MENNGLGTVEGSGLGEKKRVENEDFELKVETVHTDGLNGLKYNEGSTKGEACLEEEKTLGNSFEVDGISAGCETDKIGTVVEVTPEVYIHELEEHLNFDEADVTASTDDHSVNVETETDMAILLGSDGLVDNINDDVREVLNLVTGAEIVSEYGVGAIEKNNIFFEKSEYRLPDNTVIDGSVGLNISDIGAADREELQLHGKLQSVDDSEVRGVEVDSKMQLSESAKEMLHETDNKTQFYETSDTSTTEHKDDKNWDVDDVSDGFHCDQKSHEVGEAFNLSTGEEIVVDDRIQVNQMSGVVRHKLQNGVSFSEILNTQVPPIDEILDNGGDNKQERLLHASIKSSDSNGIEGDKLSLESQENVSNGEMFIPIEKNVKSNTTSAAFNNMNPNDNNVHLEEISSGLRYDQQADTPNNSTTLKLEVQTDCNDLEEKLSARMGVGQVGTSVKQKPDALTTHNMEAEDRRTLVTSSSVIVESKLQEGTSVSNGNLHVRVEGSAEPLEVEMTPFSEVVSVKEEKKVEDAASHVEKNPEHSLTHHKNLSVEKSNSVAGKIEKEAVIIEKAQTTTDSREPDNGPGSAAPALTPATTHPAGLGRATPLLEPSSRTMSQTHAIGTGAHIHNQVTEESVNGDAEENDETREKLQMIRVKFLRLARRLGHTAHNVVVAQVLYRLGLAEQLRGGNGGRVASYDRASAMAEQLESAGQEPLDFSCTIMVLGKSGVGKSATINSIFDQVKCGTDGFQFGTKKVRDVVGTVQGIKVRVIDTPGLLPSWSDQHRNGKMLQSVKQFIKKSPPDIVLYLDRLDMQSRDSGDMPLLRTITDTFGPSIWFNAIVVLTHAASPTPEGPDGVATGYDMFVTQRSHVVQQAIRQAAGDMRLMNPVSLVENHSVCRTNRAGQRVLPNGQVWKPHLLLLSFASKILAEANTLLKLQEGPPGKPFTARARAPRLPHLLTALLRPRPQLKLPQEQYDDDDTLDDDDESTNPDDESEYDELPPFKNLSKAELAELSKSQKKAYYDELEYREKLYLKKQFLEEKQRRRLIKKMAAAAKDLPIEHGPVEETGGDPSATDPITDLPLPASFDSDNPTHRYRCLDTTDQWLVGPVDDSHSWDHDVGYEGVNMETSFVLLNKIPMSFSGQVTKDKKESHSQMEVAGTVKHNAGKASTLSLEMQQTGKDIAYTVRSDTKFSNFRRNKATASLSVTRIGDAVTAGAKVEDRLIVSRQAQVVMSGSAIVGQGDVAYGGSVEASLRDKDFPLGRFLATLSLSAMDCHGDLVTRWNAQTQIPIGRGANFIGSVNINNRGQGQVAIRLNSSSQLKIALVALVPLFRKLFGYSNQMQFEY